MLLPRVIRKSISNNMVILQRRVALAPHYPATMMVSMSNPITSSQVRDFSKRGKIAKMISSLREQAVLPTHEVAVDKREKAKEKKKARKSGIKVGEHHDSDHDSHDDDDDDDDNHDEEVSILPDPKDVKQNMMKVVNHLMESFKSIRGAQPTPEFLDAVSVQAYGDWVPLSTVGQVVIVTPTLATVTPFDPSLAKEIQRALRDTLELNPQLEAEGGADNNSGVVRVPLPRVSLETRQKIVKTLGKKAETSRTRIRNIRRKAMDKVKEGKDGNLEGISKDDAFRVGKEIEAVVEEVIAKIDDIVREKEASVMNA
jgi:ribosome recycling factor